MNIFYIVMNFWRAVWAVRYFFIIFAGDCLGNRRKIKNTHNNYNNYRYYSYGKRT